MTVAPKQTITRWAAPPSQPTNGWEGYLQWVNLVEDGDSYVYQGNFCVGGDWAAMIMYREGGVGKVAITAFANMNASFTANLGYILSPGASIINRLGTSEPQLLVQPMAWQEAHVYALYCVRHATMPNWWEFWVYDATANAWSGIGALEMRANKGVEASLLSGTYDAIFSTMYWNAAQKNACNLFPVGAAHFGPPVLYSVRWGANVSSSGGADSVADLPGASPSCTSHVSATDLPPWHTHWQNA